MILFLFGGSDTEKREILSSINENQQTTMPSKYQKEVQHLKSRINKLEHQNAVMKATMIGLLSDNQKMMSAPFQPEDKPQKPKVILKTIRVPVEVRPQKKSVAPKNNPSTVGSDVKAKEKSRESQYSNDTWLGFETPEDQIPPVEEVSVNTVKLDHSGRIIRLNQRE